MPYTYNKETESEITYYYRRAVPIAFNELIVRREKN